MVSRIPKSFSESLAFIWHPKVLMQQVRGRPRWSSSSFTCNLARSMKYCWRSGSAAGGVMSLSSIVVLDSSIHLLLTVPTFMLPETGGFRHAVTRKLAGPHGPANYNH